MIGQADAVTFVLKISTMKTSVTALLLLISLTGLTQKCGYYYFQNNKTVTMGIFNKRGSQEGRMVYKILEVKRQGGAVTARINSAFYDKKDNPTAESSGHMRCTGGVLYLDMRFALQPGQGAQTQETEATASGDFLEYPSVMEVGQNLKDGNFDMEVKMGNGIMSRVKMDITNRRVLSKESVTTPGGTWEAYKIGYHAKTVVNIGIAIPFNTESTEWFVPDFGVVKSESRGGRTELLSIE
jgi:hypothetical protein